MKPALIEAAERMARDTGLLCLAGEWSDNAIACALANGKLRRKEPDGRYAWHDDNTCLGREQFYWCDERGGHGWMCTRCYSLTYMRLIT